LKQYNIDEKRLELMILISVLAHRSPYTGWIASETNGREYSYSIRYHHL